MAVEMPRSEARAGASLGAGEAERGGAVARASSPADVPDGVREVERLQPLQHLPAQRPRLRHRLRPEEPPPSSSLGPHAFPPRPPPPLPPGAPPGSQGARASSARAPWPDAHGARVHAP